MRNMAFAALAGQSGCATTIIIFGAMFLGMWLDSILGTKPILTLVLLVSSVPVSMYIMLRMVLGAVKRITPPPKSSAAIIGNDDDD